MEIKDRIVVVTGAAGGIGRALAECFAEAGAKRVICADLDGEGAQATPTPSAVSAGGSMSPRKVRSRH